MALNHFKKSSFYGCGWMRGFDWTLNPFQLVSQLQILGAWHFVLVMYFTLNSFWTLSNIIYMSAQESKHLCATMKDAVYSEAAQHKIGVLTGGTRDCNGKTLSPIVSLVWQISYVKIEADQYPQAILRHIWETSKNAEFFFGKTVGIVRPNAMQWLW